MRRSPAERFLGHAILVIAALIALYPFVTIVALAFTPKEEHVAGFAIPSHPTLANFSAAWTEGGFSRALFSSLVVAVGVVVLSVIVSTLAGYAISTIRFPGRSVLVAFLLIGLVMPYEGIIVPLYYQLQGLGLLNTYWALILPQVATSVSLGVFWMRTVFDGVPPGLQDAARVDGAGRLRTLVSVYLPISTSGIQTLATLLFLFTWNEFLMPLVLVAQNPDVQTAPLALSFFAGNTRNFDPGTTAAAAVLVALPILLFYVVLQRRFITGVAAGAVKE
ncbi:MAG: carbohydrate ABC transporter permease [Nostocoides sp.]